jgi:hypothetical protein
MTKEEVLAELIDQLLTKKTYRDIIYLDRDHQLEFRTTSNKLMCAILLVRNKSPWGDPMQCKPFLGYNEWGDLIEFYNQSDFYTFSPNTNKDNGVKFCTGLTDDLDRLILYFQTKLIELT